MSVGRVRILVESHGSYGESTFELLTSQLLILSLQPSSHPPLYGSMPRPKLVPGERTLHSNGNHYLFVRANSSVRPMWPQALESNWW